MTKIKAMEKFDCKCMRCGKVLQADKFAHFHHLRSYNKEHNMSDMFEHYNDDKINEELNKTVLLCADCHKALHKTLGKKVYKKQSLAFIANNN